MIRAFIAAACVLAITHGELGCEATDWWAGVAKQQITPEQPMLMAGYAARTKPADNKLTDLWAKALVIEDAGGSRGVIITLDLVGIDRVLANEICSSLQMEHGLDRRQISICVSHTHTGPAVGMNLGPMHYLMANKKQQQQIDEYSLELHREVVEVVGRAIENLQPAKLRWGNGHCTFAVNRRENAPYDRVPQLRTSNALKGPVDHDVPVLAVHDEEDNLMSVLFGYACHATVLDSQQWSGDYPGFAQLELERRHPDAVALFWAGCGADQNPLPRRSVQLAEHYGRQLAGAVDSVILTSAMTKVTGELLMEYQEVDLPLAELPTKEQLLADSESANRFVASRARMLLDQLKSGPLQPTYPYPISTWKIGNEVQFIALGGEVVVDFAIRLKTELDGIRTWVAGYAHDVMAYIPSRRVLLEGGYEGGGAMVYYGLPTVWAPQVENEIVGEVHRQLKLLEDQTALDLEGRLELFTDDFLLESLEGDIHRNLMLPDAREVVFVADKPWEGNTTGYYTLFRDGDLYRMVYRGWQHDENMKASHDEVTCYAESTDGIHWTRPNLGLYEWNGSKENNIIWLGTGTHNFTVFRDDNPACSPEARYKALGIGGGADGQPRGLLAFQSPDCQTWKVIRKKPVITHGAFDSQNLAFWDPERNEYRAYWRYFGDGVRAIRTATSKDFIHWENEADLTYSSGTPSEHLYTNAIQKYFRAPHLFVGFPTRFEPKSQQVEPILMTSRDGLQFHRWSEPVVPRTAPKDRNHNRSNYMTWGMFQLPAEPDAISVYATENYYEATPGRLRRFVYRVDGFAAVRAGEQGGVLTTRPLVHRGNRLELNFKTHKDGSITVLAFDRSGKVIGESEPLQGDAVDEPVRWKRTIDTQSPLVKLQFQMKNADLYAFRLGE